jgi:hypothetical protein
MGFYGQRAFIGFLTLVHTSAFAQSANEQGGVAFPKRRPRVEAIWVGEKQNLTVSFLGFTGLRFEIEVLPFETVNNRKTYHTRAHVEIAALPSLFYSLDDMAESWIDYEGVFSHRFHLLQKESKIEREAWEEHDQVKGESVYKNKSQKKGERPESSQTVASITRFSQDTFSSYFYLRSLPLEIGETYRVPVVSEGNTMQVQAVVQGVDLIKACGERRQALQIRLDKLDGEGKPLPGQNNLVWLSNDERHILLRVDVTARFGHIVGELTAFTSGTLSQDSPAAH